MSPPLRIAYTPDSDDVFNYFAWEHGHVALESVQEKPEFHRDHIQGLNRAALEERFDVVAVSSVMYPRLAGRYWILGVGNSVGRGWGPVVASRRFDSVADLHGRRVATGGIPTTGSVLAEMYCPGIELVQMPYDRIADAVSRDEVDAGVMIHEELLYFPQKGLRPVIDLGRAWHDDTGLPLPVGLALVRREVGLELAIDIARCCQRSLLWAFEHREEVYGFASRFGRGEAQRHVEMFSNEDTFSLAPDTREALRVLFERIAGPNSGPTPVLDIIDGGLSLR